MGPNKLFERTRRTAPLKSNAPMHLLLSVGRGLVLLFLQGHLEAIPVDVSLVGLDPIASTCKEAGLARNYMQDFAYIQGCEGNHALPSSAILCSWLSRPRPSPAGAGLL